MEKNGKICSCEICSLLQNFFSCFNVRSDSVVGMVGTTMTSAAYKTFSVTNDILGGQSKNTKS